VEAVEVVVIEVVVVVGVVEVGILEALEVVVVEEVVVEEVFVGEVRFVDPEVRMVLVLFDEIEVAFVLKLPPINDRLLANKRAGG
jgi:hypothetical protein